MLLVIYYLLLAIQQGVRLLGNKYVIIISFRYFDNPDLSDLVLVVGNNRFYAHKFALAAQSDVFRDLLLSNERCTGCPDFQKVSCLVNEISLTVKQHQYILRFYLSRFSTNPIDF